MSLHKSDYRDAMLLRCKTKKLSTGVALTQCYVLAEWVISTILFLFFKSQSGAKKSRGKSGRSREGEARAVGGGENKVYQGEQAHCHTVLWSTLDPLTRTNHASWCLSSDHIEIRGNKFQIIFKALFGDFGKILGSVKWALAKLWPVQAPISSILKRSVHISLNKTHFYKKSEYLAFCDKASEGCDPVCLASTHGWRTWSRCRSY